MPNRLINTDNKYISASIGYLIHIGISSWSIIIILTLLVLFPFRVQAHPPEIIDKIQNTVSEPRFLVYVPFFGAPIHENMTKASFNNSNVSGKRHFNVKKDENYIHGVFWNDDPEDMLCPQCSAFNPGRIDNITFAKRFFTAQRKVQEANKYSSSLVFKVGDGLLERSHFGDLQFLHGMASTDGEYAGDTQNKMLLWAEFTYKVAIREIPKETKLNQIPISFVRQLFVGDRKLKNLTVEQLFKNRKSTERVAIGSLLHMIQDSYAPGHVERNISDYITPVGNKVFSRSFIKEFHCYTNQDEDKHKQDDNWPEGLDMFYPLGEQNPVSVGTRILEYMEDGAPWVDVKKYLEEYVFRVTDQKFPAGPGEKYRKKVI